MKHRKTNPIRWANRLHAERQKATRTGAYAPPTAPMTVRNVYAWDPLVAARNDAETVAKIRAFLGRQHRINLAAQAA